MKVATLLYKINEPLAILIDLIFCRVISICLDQSNPIIFAIDLVPCLN